MDILSREYLIISYLLLLVFNCAGFSGIGLPAIGFTGIGFSDDGETYNGQLSRLIGLIFTQIVISFLGNYFTQYFFVWDFPDVDNQVMDR